jgi:hypothetical protein
MARVSAAKPGGEKISKLAICSQPCGPRPRELTG